jgi:hypothetical protein
MKPNSTLFSSLRGQNSFGYQTLKVIKLPKKKCLFVTTQELRGKSSFFNPQPREMEYLKVKPLRLTKHQLQLL